MKNLVSVFLTLLCFCFSQTSFADYKDLSAEDKATAEINFRRYQSFSEDKKQIINENWQRYQALPVADQIKLTERFTKFKKLNPAQKEKVLIKAGQRVLKKAERHLEKKQDKMKSAALKREFHGARRRLKPNTCVDGKCERK